MAGTDTQKCCIVCHYKKKEAEEQASGFQAHLWVSDVLKGRHRGILWEMVGGKTVHKWLEKGDDNVAVSQCTVLPAKGSRTYSCPCPASYFP